MNPRFQILDTRETPMGTISVRRRLEPILQVDVWEVILGDEHLMSSIFTTAEIALADLGLAAVAPEHDELDVVVGGLGLGYTARAALADDRVRSLDVVDALGEVIEWTEAGILPGAEQLTADPRCRLVHGDFFTAVAEGRPFGPGGPEQVHAILVDIDHTPRHLLHPSHAPFYEVDGLRTLAGRLVPGGVFALWSDVRPDDRYLAAVDEVFAASEVHDVRFPNHHTGGEAANTVIVAVR